MSPDVQSEWPICTIGSRDRAGGQGLQNHHRKCMVSADSTALSQLPFVIEKIDGKHTLCGCSRVDCEYYMNQSWNASQLGLAMKNLAANFYVHVINGQVQRDEASLSCCTNSSSNLASYCWH